MRLRLGLGLPSTLLLAIFIAATASLGQNPPPTAPAATPPNATPNTAPEAGIGKPVHADSLHSQRKAAKLYLEGTRLLAKEQPEAAWKLLKSAADLTPDNATYARAAEVARQATVTSLVQQSSRERARSGEDAPEAAKLLQQALAIDPKSPLVLEHLNELGDLQARAGVGTTASSEAQNDSGELAGPIELQPTLGKQSFHLKTDSRQAVIQVFRAYGIEASLHESILSKPVRLDVDDATFPQAMRMLSLLTATFWEPLDPHRVVVAQDTTENRTQFQRLQTETIYLPGLDEKELTDVGNMARNVFDAQQSVADQSSRTLTLRASSNTLHAFNRTVALLEDGKNQLDLDVKVIQLAHVAARESGTTFFQQTGVYNVFSEIQSILSQNQSLVQQIISSGLVANDNTLANQIEILAILVASGQLTGTPFNQGFLPFGGGLTESILSPGPATLALSLNSSDTRILDDIHLRLSDDEAGTFKIGERYPITTSTFSSVALPAVPGLGAAVTAAENQVVPQIQYEDLGLTLKATPRVMRSEDVALTVDLKIESLGGGALNDIPILNSQQFSGVLTMKAGETAVLVSDLSRQESRALSGLPGVSDIPGLQDVSDISRNQNVARLLILVTPSVVRDSPEQRARGPRLLVNKTTNGH